MPIKRYYKRARLMKAYLVTVRWQYGGSTITRRIAENGSTPRAAARKVMDKYNSPKKINDLGKPEFVSVVSYW